MNKELKVIDFYCKKCKKSMKVSYMVTGNKNYPVLPRVINEVSSLWQGNDFEEFQGRRIAG